MDIKFYCCIGETQWNHHPVAPGRYAVIAPVRGSKKRVENRVRVPSDCEIIQDSGAFSDNTSNRLTFEEALQRQIIHAAKWGYTNQITHRASYDVLIDEVWTDGNRYKRRWSEFDAWAAADTTVNAAAYLHQNRNGLSLVQSAQGVTPEQYLICTKRLMPYMQTGDIFGLGGWCITGKLPAVMTPVFRDTMRLVIPFVAAQGIERVHIWGVMYAKVLGELLHLCDQHGLELSTDSAGPSARPCRGQWGYAEWRIKNYQRPEPAIRGLERARHVGLCSTWLADFRSTKHYKPAPVVKAVKQPYQLPLFEMAA